jgi:hypothetical protein
VREAHLKIKNDMKRRHDVRLKLVDLGVGDLCYKYNAAVPKRTENLPASRLHKHWTGPYFVTKIEGENASIYDDKKDQTLLLHRNLLRRYVYPLAGIHLLGERRAAYLVEVTGKRVVNGAVEYQGLWRSQTDTELEWLAEEDVPSALVEEFDARTTASAFVVGV